MSEITDLPALALAERIHDGRLTAIGVVEAYLERIFHEDPRIAAYVTLLAGRARAEAVTRDAEARSGRWRGPLHGVPVAVKDLIQIEGVPLTAGSSFLGGEPSPETATVVRLLEDAGAIVLGTTTLHEFALGMTSLNPHGRTPRNPWRLDRVAGGSSGGSAAAVAAHLAAGAVGTDTGGSVRIPAALCGVVGLKPTFGRISRHGVLPLSGSFDTVGPIARCVTDAALFLGVMAGVDPADPASRDVPVDAYLEQAERARPGLRVGRLSGPFFESDLDPAAAQAVEDAARACVEAGFTVRPVFLRTPEEANLAQVTLLLAEAAAFHRDAYPGMRERYGRDVRALLDQGETVTAEMLSEARKVQSRVMAEISGVFGEVDLLLGPALPAGAPRLEDADPQGAAWSQVRQMLGRFSRLHNLAGLPAIVLPAGLTSEGLPVAVQLAAGQFREGTLLGCARVIEQALGWPPSG
ncbi:MAG: amidase [Armatimonadetes bacterium]|nr:amidase [Armatimonadota bacterium]